MSIESKDITAHGKRFSYTDGGIEIGRAYLYLMTNDLHPNIPFGLMEDVFIEEYARGRKIGSALVQEVIDEAKRQGCYKLICTSRHTKPEVHRLYERLGFKDHGKEFRMEF